MLVLPCGIIIMGRREEGGGEKRYRDGTPITSSLETQGQYTYFFTNDWWPQPGRIFFFHLLTC